jgi:DNA end-binding protein Ku
MVALGRVVFTSREHVIALEPRDKGLLGITLRYPYEVRKQSEYFDDIPDEKIPKDMLELASHIVKSKAGHFHPEKFEDQYEAHRPRSTPPVFFGLSLHRSAFLGDGNLGG